MQILIAKSEATVISSRQGASDSRLQRAFAFALVYFPSGVVLCPSAASRALQCSPSPFCFGRPALPSPDRLQHAARFHFGWRALPSLVDSLRAQALLVAPFLLYRRSAIGIIHYIVNSVSSKHSTRTALSYTLLPPSPFAAAVRLVAVAVPCRSLLGPRDPIVPAAAAPVIDRPSAQEPPRHLVRIAAIP
jgi:hypothetical protein